MERKDVLTSAMQIGDYEHVTMTHLPSGTVVSGETRRSRYLLREELYEQLKIKVEKL